MSARQTWTILRDTRPAEARRAQHEHRLPTPANWPAGTIVRCPCGQRFKRPSPTAYDTARWVRRRLPWPR